MTYYPPASGMPDPVVLSTMTPELMGAADFGGQAASSTTWPAINQARFYPVRLSQPHTYVKAWWVNGGTAAGNVDVGIYTLSGTTLTRVVASTAEAQGTVSTLQVAATFTSTTVGPGLYYLGMSCSVSSATMWMSSPSIGLLRAVGAFISGSSHPLPSSCSTTIATGSRVPLFGFSESTAI